MVVFPLKFWDSQILDHTNFTKMYLKSRCSSELFSKLTRSIDNDIIRNSENLTLFLLFFASGGAYFFLDFGNPCLSYPPPYPEPARTVCQIFFSFVRFLRSKFDHSVGGMML